MILNNFYKDLCTSGTNLLWKGLSADRLSVMKLPGMQQNYFFIYFFLRVLNTERSCSAFTIKKRFGEAYPLPD